MIAAALSYLQQATGLPRPVWAVIAGTLIAFGATQRLKFYLPPRWSAHLREVSTQALGFTSGFVSTYLLWGTRDTDALLAGLIVGLWIPAAWNVLMLVLGHWKPGLREALSQNERTLK